jgi:hypothetical protein
MTYIEDYLEYLCNNQLDSLQSCNAIYFSIYKQITRGVGITDRQYALVLKKIQEYMDVDDLPTRTPLRSIDRSKYITLVDNIENTVYESYKDNWKWIKVRFPFSKKDIAKVDSIGISHNEYYHKKGSHEHYYKFTSKNVYKIINVLKNRNFKIEDTLFEYYEKINDVVNVKFDVYENCIPDTVKKELSELSNLQHADRGLRYGYNTPPTDSDTITNIIAYRQDIEVCLDPKKYKVQDIIETVNLLDRFPLLVLIDEDTSYIQLKQIHSEVSKIIDNKHQSVLFRIDSKDANNAPVNDYIKDNHLNNWVDNETKVVYIKKSKLPKVLLQSNFKPMCTLSKTSTRCNKNVKTYMETFCDCILYHDVSLSLFGRTNVYM